jgi:acetoin:2,6-dichlorophenolindophenol oxidoreductase subunit beta
MTEVRFIDAIRAALDDELTTDPTVVLLGEDLTMGGPFGATKDLADRHGLWRVRNTPISEATVMGMAVGAALCGLRPVVEVMFMDFMTLAMDQLVNHGAKFRYMSGGRLRVPLTIRVQFGASGGFGAHHSQSLEAWFTHVPGLRVLAPSTPADAYHGLRAAIRAEDPVLFLEHRSLYWLRGPSAAPDEDDPEPWRAAVRRTGGDVTVVAWSRMVGTAMAAAEQLSDVGIEATVIDARALAPLDLEAIVGAVQRTGRLVVVAEEVVSGGLGAEIAAAVTSEAFASLIAPVVRVGAPFVPPPAGPSLEALYVPSVEKVVSVVRDLVGTTMKSRARSSNPASTLGGGTGLP